MKKILLPIILILLVLTSVMLWMTKDPSGALQPVAGTPSSELANQPPPAIGGSFSLTNQNGQSVTDADFRGRLMLVFFGFTNCPDICPITAKSMSDMMALLGDKADQVAPIFITVDPGRDTPEVMKNYFASFDARIQALTGTPEQIKQAASAYKAYYAKAQQEGGEAQQMVDRDQMKELEDHEGHGAAQNDPHAGHDAHAGHGAHGNYLVDHSGYIYLMNREGVYVKHFQYDASPEQLAAAVKELLN
ncbi:MAG: SCO family protein [Alphaproteobacteria bacterium]|nr:SCO family protein [Alphaproteobacteria bacterium]